MLDAPLRALADARSPDPDGGTGPARSIHDVIGSVLDLLDLDPLSGAPFPPPPRPVSPPSSRHDSLRHHSAAPDMDLDLEAAIGNAFASFGSGHLFDAKADPLPHRHAPGHDASAAHASDPITAACARSVSATKDAFGSDDPSAYVLAAHEVAAHEEPAHDPRQQALDHDLNAAFDTAFEQAIKNMSQSGQSEKSESHNEAQNESHNEQIESHKEQIEQIEASPHNNASDSNAPQNNAIQINVPHDNASDSNAPQNNAIQINVPHDNASDSNASQNNAIQINAPETNAPQSTSLDSNLPLRVPPTAHIHGLPLENIPANPPNDGQGALHQNIPSKPDIDGSLDAAIGDALSSVGATATSAAQSDDALSQTIENIFGSLMDEPSAQSPPSHVSQKPHYRPPPSPPRPGPNADHADHDHDHADLDADHDHDHHHADLDADHDHADLDAAIGDAFKSVMSPHRTAPPPPPHLNEDMNLEAAIAEAFSSIGSAPPLHTTTSSAASSNPPLPLSSLPLSSLPNPPFALASWPNSMSPYVKEILEKSELKDKEHAQEHAIQVLAKQIKSNFQDKALDEFGARDLSLPSADDHADLEELKMNDILLKAFNMAMENPEALILDLDVDIGFLHNRQAALALAPRPPASAPDPARPHSKMGLSSHFPSTAAASAPSKPASALAPKPLSIAETLAIHRSLMKSRTDAAESPLSAEGTSLLNSPLGIRISQAMSAVVANNSNSYREISESSILSVIRRMNSMGPYASALSGLALPELSLTSSNTVAEILDSLRTKPERVNVQRALLDAQTFLHHENGPIASKVSSILDSLLQKLGPAPPLAAPSKLAHDSIQFYSESIVSTMASFDRFARDKPGLDQDGAAPRDIGLSRRVCNRERKKRWREGNTERNKDIDLRMRVTRRATAIHGEEDTPKKREWIEAEFASRRQKRILRNGVDDDADKLDPHSRKNDERIESDPRLVVPINSLFNLVVKLTEADTPEIALKAISSSTAAAAAAYAKEKKLEFRAVNTAVTLLIANLMELNEHHQRVSAIAQNISNSFRSAGASNTPPPPQTHDPVESHLFSRITQTIKDIASGSPPLQMQKRPYPPIATPLKRPKVEGDGEGGLAVGSASMLANSATPSSYPTTTSYTTTSASVPFNTTSWISGAIKMPHYKPKEAGDHVQAVPAPAAVDSASRANRPALSLPAASPFLSNKALGAKSSFKPGLRKPGSFQRPGNMARETPGPARPFGIPALHSASPTLG